MTRFKLTLEYDGSYFYGWQAQDGLATVQTTLENAIHRFTNETVRVHGSGRTDAGVHATGQVAHVDIEKVLKPDNVMGAINFHVGDAPVSVHKVEVVDEEFHARFSATRRHYLFRILPRRARPALLKDRVWHVPVKLNADAMHDAAQALVGQHDFTTFRHIACQAKSPLKTLDRLDVRQVGEEIHVTASARSFLHHQVRSMVGTLKLVGEGKWTRADVKAALEAADRKRVGLNAPPEGLYLTQVDY